MEHREGPFATGLAQMGRAARTGLVVGTVLTLINHGGALAGRPLNPGLLARIGLTYAVPFLVSLYAMMGMVAERRSGQRADGNGTFRCRLCGDEVALVGSTGRMPACRSCGTDGRCVSTDG